MQQRAPLPNAAHLAEIAKQLELEAEFARIEARLAAIDYELERQRAHFNNSRRRRAIEAAQLVERQRLVASRQAMLASGLGFALAGGAMALFNSVPRTHPIGLPELPGRR